jgi:hypothetical protein
MPCPVDVPMRRDINRSLCATVLLLYRTVQEQEPTALIENTIVTAS